MKLFYFVSLLAIVSFTSCKTQQTIVNQSPKEVEVAKKDPRKGIPLDEYGMPVLLEYSETTIDLGKVPKGEKRNLEFAYKNVSNEEVEIEIVSACSCTETDFTVAQMKPGEGGKIVLVFDSTSKEQSETIDVNVILRNTYGDDMPIVNILYFKYELMDKDGKKPYLSTKKEKAGH